jgi:uncharacterized membrane protein YdjX (TVP38/TMEM64 family)
MVKNKQQKVAGLFLLVLAIAIVLVFLPVKDLLVEFLDWVKNLGPKGAALIALIYIPACVLFVPGSLITLGAGFAFGVPLATAAISIGSTIGASCAFLLGRTLVREWVVSKVSGNQRFTAIDQAVHRHGFKIVLLTRLSPAFPFNMLNYAYGVTGVSFKEYFLASWIGMLPGTILYVYLGSAVRSVTEIGSGQVGANTGQKILFGAGLVATILVVWYVTRVARKAIREVAVTKEEREEGPATG